jgi:excisionase family DNA binding protein
MRVELPPFFGGDARVNTTVLPDRLLTTDELSEYLTIPVTTLYAWRTRDLGPRAIRVGRHLRYRVEDVLAWLEEQGNDPEKTSDPGGSPSPTKTAGAGGGRVPR